METLTVCPEMSRRALLGEISEITDYLFLSGASELKPNKLRRKRITSIINATTEEPNAYLAGIDYMKVAIEDSAFARIDQYFDIVADRIKMVKDRGGRTLVHCVAGVSRSATLCIVYLVKYEKMTLRRAYSFVKSARPIIRPNIGFWRQMIEYERHLRGTTSVSMVSTTACDQPIPDVYASELKQPFLNGASASKTNVANIPVSMPSVFNRSLLPSSPSNRPTIGFRRSSPPSTTSLSPSTSLFPLSSRFVSRTLLSPAPYRKKDVPYTFDDLYHSAFPAF